MITLDAAICKENTARQKWVTSKPPSYDEENPLLDGMDEEDRILRRKLWNDWCEAAEELRAVRKATKTEAGK